MISTSSTGECAASFYFCKSTQESEGRVSTSVTDSRLPSPGWCTIAPGNGGMRRCPSLHLQLWDSPTLLSWWWRSFSDPSKIMWPTTYMTSNKIFFFLLCQILALFHISLGQQLNLYWVHKVQWVAQVLLVPVTPDKSWHPLCLFCLGRLECWLRCWPLSPVLSLLMTYGAVSGTSYWYHCRFDEFKVFWNDLDDDLGENSLPTLRQKWFCLTNRQKLLLAHIVLLLCAHSLVFLSEWFSYLCDKYSVLVWRCLLAAESLERRS